jgi:fumarylacetoacetate (FAA) hydrolase
MKLASLKTGRDGELIVVNKDLSRAVKVAEIALTIQNALDNWLEVAPKLRKISHDLNMDDVYESFALDIKQLAAPMPRAYQWLDGSTYVTHVELVRKARGATMPESFWHDPLMYQGGSDAFIGPMDAIKIENEDWGIDFEAEIALITRDVPMGVPTEDAGDYILGFMLVNDVSLRNLIPGELAKNFGFVQSKPTTAFSPVFVTPDELGAAWDGTKINLPLQSTLNGTQFGAPEAGVDMTFNFPKLISHAAKTRNLVAGTIIGSGTVSNKDHSKGSSCIAEKRMLEIIDSGKPKTSFMKFGDHIRIEMFDKDGSSIFGAIDQQVKKYEYKREQVLKRA